LIVTDRLVKALERADNPRAIRALSWALEQTTGVKTTQIVATFSLNEQKWERIYGAAGYGGNSSSSGINVTVDVAFEVSAVLACVKLIAEDMGSLGFFLYRRSKDGKTTEEATEHPLYPILSGLASPETSSGEFIEALTAHALLMGNGYALIERNARTSEPMWLYPLMPQNVRQDRDSNKRLVYIVRVDNGPEKTYSLNEVFHLRGFTFDGLKGEDILKRVKQVIGLASAGQQYAGSFFSHDASPGIILSRPQTAGKPLGVESVKAIKEAWVLWHQGLKRAHEPAVLQDGITATRLDPDHQKLQLIEQRTFQVVEVCRVFRVPPHKIAELTRSTNNNIEYQGIEYVTNTLFPWRRRWRDAVYRCLFTREEQIEGRLYADHNVEELLRGDFKSQTEGFRAMLEKGVYKINEVRRWLNLNPVVGGDENRVQLNTVAISEAAQQLVDAIGKAKAGTLSGQELAELKEILGGV